MFRIKFFTPSVMNEEGWQHAGGELVVGDARMCFLVDLTYWGMADYHHQWRGGMTRLLQGAPSTALMLSGLISIALGVFLVARPGAGALSVLWVIATYAVLFGIILIVLAFRVRSFANRLGAAARG